jgi:hypothetical protein
MAQREADGCFFYIAIFTVVFLLSSWLLSLQRSQEKENAEEQTDAVLNVLFVDVCTRFVSLNTTRVAQRQTDGSFFLILLFSPSYFFFLLSCCHDNESKKGKTQKNKHTLFSTCCSSMFARALYR